MRSAARLSGAGSGRLRRMGHRYRTAVTFVIGIALAATASSQRYLPDFDSEDFPLLRYVDRYGTTVFNEAQMRDLLPELRLLRRRAKKAETERMIDGIIELAERGANETHLFLWWIRH